MFPQGRNIDRLTFKQLQSTNTCTQMLLFVDETIIIETLTYKCLETSSLLTIMFIGVEAKSRLLYTSPLDLNLFLSL